VGVSVVFEQLMNSTKALGDLNILGTV